MATATVLINWSEELSVGIESIDNQHKKLVNMINALNEALVEGKARDVLVKIFNGLVVYTDKHFKYEEALFAQHGYQDAAEHKAQHDALVKQVLELKSKLDDGNFMIGVEVMAFLKEWLTEHIMKTDKAYTVHLTGAGVN